MPQDVSTANREAIVFAKQYMGQFGWPTVILVVLVLAGFIANLTLFALGVVPAWTATVILAALTYMAYTPVHEAVHGNIHGKHDNLSWVNDLCGYVMAPLIAIPFASHKLEHFTHHRYTNQPNKDPDYLISGIGRGPVIPPF